MGIMEALTPFFLLTEARKVFQLGQVLKCATRFAKSIGIATLRTRALDETIENAIINFADVVLEMEKRATAEGPSHGGSLRLVKMGKTAFLREATTKQLQKDGYHHRTRNIATASTG